MSSILQAEPSLGRKNSSGAMGEVPKLIQRYPSLWWPSRWREAQIRSQLREFAKTGRVRAGKSSGLQTAQKDGATAECIF